jgi:hypothetical protein
MGLLRMAARTAVVAGTATAVSGRVQRRQANRGGDRTTKPKPRSNKTNPTTRPLPKRTRRHSNPRQHRYRPARQSGANYSSSQH